MASIGDRLREERERKNLSREEVHKSTKIHLPILKALEEDKGDEFLSSVYIKGFLKKYSQYLGLDSSLITEEYESLHPQSSAFVLAPVQEKKSKMKYPRLSSLFKIFLIIILTLLFIAYLRFILHSFSKTPAKATSKGVEIIKKTVKAPALKPSLLVAKDKPLILTIKARRDSWMQVKSDGRVIFENVLSKGKEEKWLAKEKLELWVGNAEGLQLILNGKELPSPGKGVIKGILITREGLKVGKK